MNQKLDKLLENDAFKAVPPEKINAIKEFYEKNSGKNVSQIFPEIIKLNSVLNSGKPLSPKEKEAMLEVVLTALSSEERSKLISVLSLLKNGF